MTGGAAALECRDLEVGYGAAPVLHGLGLDVASDEVVAVLGPSGSGKSTLLYTVAGFVHPTAGEIRIGGRSVATPRRSTPPEARQVGVVFQHYALWPHMTALETVAYPLRRRGVAAAAARREALDLLERMGLAALAGRRPAELSGGQQQRVGLARALARNASLYCFDEPTAHLDAPLRAALAEELAERRRAAGAAALYATHDAGEALAVADRVALLRDGRLVQVGTPRQVYEEPVDLWTARLTGPASVLDVGFEGVDGDALVLVLGAARARVPGTARSRTSGRVQALVRPDWTRLGGPLPGAVRQVWYRGTHTDYALDTPGGPVDLREPGPPRARSGEQVTWDLRHAWIV